MVFKIFSFFYHPITGFIGTDFFTFKLQLGSLSSILATIAITVDDDLTKAKKITEQRKLGANVLQSKRGSSRNSLLDTLKNTLIPGSLTYSSSKPLADMDSKANNPLSRGGGGSSDDDAKGDVELLDSSDFSRGRGMTTTHQMNESMEL